MSVLFFKAIIRGGAHADLFATPVTVAGHTTAAGTYVAPYTSIRHKAPAPLVADLPDLHPEPEPEAEPCIFCGEPERVSVHEAWGHDFMLDCCCEARRDFAVQEMAEDPDYARQLLEASGVGPLRRVAFTDEGFGQVLLDFEPRIAPISRADANAFIGRWHRHNPPLPADLFRAGVWNGSTLLGVVMAGAPTARAYMPQFAARELCEVRRLCIRTDLPRELTWRAASALYGYAAEQAAARGYRKIITYTLASEAGMSLRYARWKPEATIRGKTWNTPSRPRQDRGPVEAKVRWFKKLSPAPVTLMLRTAA